MRAPHCTVRANQVLNQKTCHVMRLVEPDWPALYSGGPRAFLWNTAPMHVCPLFVGGSGYETTSIAMSCEL